MVVKAKNAKIDRESIHEGFARIGGENGFSRSYLLEETIRRYIEFVGATQIQSTVRPEVMIHFRRSTDKNQELHKKLAGQ
jgi:hypothetical protein